MEKYYFEPMGVDLDNSYLTINKASTMLTEEEIKNKKIYFGKADNEVAPLFTIDELPEIMSQHPKLVLYKSTVEAFISKEDNEYKLAMELATDDL